MAISRPTLVVNRAIATQNIARMLNKCSDISKFRPHFKTHQSGEIAEIYRSFGVTKITVSSVEMAIFFANLGWNDITIAFPVNLLEAEDISSLARKISLNVLVESAETVDKLSTTINENLGLFIKIDSGYHRTGLEADDSEIEKILALLKQSKNLIFKGFIVHAGHTYHCENKSEIRAIFAKSGDILAKLQTRFKPEFPALITSYGDTPSCSLADSLDQFDELRPGNFVYYDLMQLSLEVCSFSQIAVAVACPVVAVHKKRLEVVIYGGGIHLSKEFLVSKTGSKYYGKVVLFTKDGWGEPIKGAEVTSVSQEHGVVRVLEKDIELFQPGNLIGIIPIHSCMSANLLKNNTRLI